MCLEQIWTTPWCGFTSIRMSRSTTVWNAGVLLWKLQRYYTPLLVSFLLSTGSLLLLLFYFHQDNLHDSIIPAAKDGVLHSTQSASDEAKEAIHHAIEEMEKQWPKQLWPGKVCDEPCECCSRYGTVIPLPKTFDLLQEEQKRQQEGSGS